MKSLSGLIVFVATVPAFGQPPIVVTGEPLPSISVSYADLDLARAHDIDKLRWRVRAAARSLCFDATREVLAVQALEWQCYSDALGSANRDIDQAVAMRRTGSSFAATAQAILVQIR